MGHERVPIEHTALRKYMELFNPGLSIGALRNRLELAAGRASQGTFTTDDGITYTTLQTGNHCNMVCYGVLSNGAVADILSKQEFKEKYRIRKNTEPDEETKSEFKFF